METILEPEYGDNKMVTALFGLSRQYLNKLEHDPLSGFPLPIKHGKNTRHRLDSVRYWHRAKEPGNEVMLAELVNKRLAIVSAVPVKASVAAESKPRPLRKRTLSQIERQNSKVLATKVNVDQVIMWSLTTSKEGASVKAYRISPSLSKTSCSNAASVSKVEVRQKKTLYLGTRPVVKAAEHLPSQKDTPATAGSIDGAIAVVRAPTSALNIAALKEAYEGGMSMDDICKHFRAGKTRVLRLLHKSGTRIRKPGRKTNQRTPQPIETSDSNSTL